MLGPARLTELYAIRARAANAQASSLASDAHMRQNRAVDQIFQACSAVRNEKGMLWELNWEKIEQCQPSNSLPQEAFVARIHESNI
eukprot:5791950-Amphidinium_carterae.2